MWNYPKSAQHQAAIDAMKPERDREVQKTRAAEAKLRRQREAVQALQERESERQAILTKTQRLRAERLAREALEPPAPKKQAKVAIKPAAKRATRKVAKSVN